MATKKTIEQVKEQFKELGFELLEENFINAKTKMKIRCQYGHEFFAHYNSIVDLHRGCPVCAKQKRGGSKKLKREAIIKIFDEGGFVLADDFYQSYNDRKSLLPCYCKKHPETQQFFSVNQISRKTKCAICRKENRQYRRKVPYTFQEIVACFPHEYNYKSLNNYDKDDIITPLSTTILKFECSRHGEFEIIARHILRGGICPSCAAENVRNKQKIDFAVIKDDFQKRGYQLLSTEKDYIGIKSPLLYICDKHPNIIQSTTYDTIKSGEGCPLCAGNKKFTFEQAQKICCDNNFTPLFNKEDYINSNTPVLVKCNNTNKETMVIITDINKRRHACPWCSHNSMGEYLIRTFLNDNRIDFIAQKTFDGCVDKQKLQYDFYLPQYNLCIEYQGEQHYQIVCFGGKGHLQEAIDNFNTVQLHDKIKREYCKKNGIGLLEIPYWEKENLANIIQRELKFL